MTKIRVILPYHLRNLARVDDEIEVEVTGTITLGAALDAVERKYPMLCGTIRDHVTKERRAFLRFFACGQDFSHAAPETLLPDAVSQGKEPLIVLGAISGG